MLCMLQEISHWMSIPSYVGQQDRMDTEDRHAVYGTRDYTLDVHPGTIGQDGQLGSTCCVWYKGLYTGCPSWDNRIGWTVRIDMLCMVQGIIHWMSIPSYVGQQDRMDTEDRHAVYGTRDYTLDVHPILCGTIGQDGQLGSTYCVSACCVWYKGLYTGCPSYPMWDNRIGWTLRIGMLCMVQGIIHWMSILSYHIWDNRIGWTVRIGMLCIIQGITHWMSIPFYVGQQDWMDRIMCMLQVIIQWYVCPSYVSYVGQYIGQNGQLQSACCASTYGTRGYIVDVHFMLCVPEIEQVRNGTKWISYLEQWITMANLDMCGLPWPDSIGLLFWGVDLQPCKTMTDTLAPVEHADWV